jgi:hypothetical protein
MAEHRRRRLGGLAAVKRPGRWRQRRVTERLDRPSRLEGRELAEGLVLDLEEIWAGSRS